MRAKAGQSNRRSATPNISRTRHRTDTLQHKAQPGDAKVQVWVATL